MNDMGEGEAPHILVVDDDERLRQLLHRYLVQNGYYATTAADAGEAKVRLKSIAFDLMVLDIMMPGQDGLSLTEELRRLLVQLGVPSFALGRADPACLGKAATEWGDYYTHRPVVVAGRLSSALARLAAARPR